MGHAERNHAVLSASGAHRWLNCPGSVMLEAQFPETTSEAAMEGTLAHELAEMKLRHYFFTADYSRKKLSAGINKLKKNELWQEEMQGYTDEYLDYIKGAAVAMKSVPYVAIEKKVDFSAYIPEGFGTADCILICGQDLYIIDLKYGKSPNGRVDAENNSQMMLYALGAYEAYRLLYPIKTIHLAIVQPRLSDGISEWSCSVDELLKFGSYAKERAALALSGKGEFNPDVKTCKWCRAKAQCRARAEKNVTLAFAAGSLPPLITVEEAGRYLTVGEDVANWLGNLQEWALKECLSGNEVPGWKVVEGRSSRTWTDMDGAFETLTAVGYDEALLWERKPLTLAQVEKAIGKKDFVEYVGNYVVKTPGKPTLVKESDRRPAINNKITAQEAFKEVK